MFEQLAALSDELDRLEADLPRIYAAGDRRASRDAGRRQQELKPVVDAYAEWKKVSQDVEEARDVLESTTDPAERDSWRAEVADKERLLARRPSPRPMPGTTRPNRIGRNDPCPCGSGKKFKHCCMRT